MERLGYVPAPLAGAHESLPIMRCACGQLLPTSGAINLYWRIHPNGTKVFCTLYYVVPGSDHLDLVVGEKTLDREGLVIPNPSPIITLTQHEREKKSKWECLLFIRTELTTLMASRRGKY